MRRIIHVSIRPPRAISAARTNKISVDSHAQSANLTINSNTISFNQNYSVRIPA